MEKYKTTGVCASEIQFEIKDSIIEKVQFIGGCPGNAIGVAHLIQGYKVEEAITRLKGIDCRGKGTSCPDQLAKALEAYLEK